MPNLCSSKSQICGFNADRGEKVRKRRVNSAKKKKTRQPLSAFATEALERSQRDAKADNVTTDPAAQSLATNNTLTSMMARKAQTHPQGYRIPPSQLFVGSHDLDVPRICAPNYNTPPIHSFPMERTITQSPAATYLGGCPPHHSLSVSNTTGSPRPLHFGGYLPHHSPSANNISGAPIPSPFGGYPQHCLLPISKYTEAPNQSSNVSSSTNDADPMPLIFVTAFSTRPDHLRLPTSGEKRVIYHSSYDRYFLLERKEDVNLTLKDNKSWLYPIALRLSNENAYPNLSTLQTSNYK